MTERRDADAVAAGIAGINLGDEEARGRDFMAMVNNQALAMDRMATYMGRLTDRLEGAPGPGGAPGGAVGEAPAGVAAGGGLGTQGKYSLKFQTYTGEAGDVFADFLRFEQNVRLVSTVMNYKMPTVATAILGQLRGRAADIGRALRDREAEYATLDAFLDKLRSLFVSPAYREKARAAFLSRKQGHDESIIVFHGILLALHEAAYAEADRQVATLIRQFISGLKNPEIVKQLIIGKPATYQEALESALKWEGDLDIVALTLQWQKKGGSGVLSHSIAGTPSNPGNGYGEPMEIGAVGRGRGRAGRGRKIRPPGRRTSSVRTRSMTRPTRSTNVFALQTQTRFRGRNPQRAPSVGPSRSVSAVRPGTGNCFNCNKPGHWARECRLPKRSFRGSQKSVNWARPPNRSQTPQRSGSRSRVLAIAKKPQFFGQERRETKSKN